MRHERARPFVILFAEDWLSRSVPAGDPPRGAFCLDATFYAGRPPGDARRMRLSFTNRLSEQIEEGLGRLARGRAQPQLQRRHQRSAGAPRGVGNGSNRAQFSGRRTVPNGSIATLPRTRKLFRGQGLSRPEVVAAPYKERGRLRMGLVPYVVGRHNKMLGLDTDPSTCQVV